MDLARIGVLLCGSGLLAAAFALSLGERTARTPEVRSGTGAAAELLAGAAGPSESPSSRPGRGARTDTAPPRPAGTAEVPATGRGFGTELALQLGAAALQGRLRAGGADPLDLRVASERDALAWLRAGLGVVALRVGPGDLDNADRAAGLDELTLGRAAVFGFVVDPRARVDGLTTAELRRVLAGATPDWRRLRGADLPVQVLLGGPAAARRAMLDQLVMRGRALWPEVVLRDDPRQLAADFANRPGALAVVDLDRWRGPPPLPIDGVPASRAGFEAGHYPFGLRLRLVFRRGQGGVLGGAIAALGRECAHLDLASLSAGAVAVAAPPR